MCVLLYNVSKKSHLCLAITLTHVDGLWYFFRRNVTNKVSNQNMLYYVTSNNLRFCTTWQNRETRKLHFSLKCCISAFPEFNQLLNFFSLFDSRPMFTLLYDSLNLVINAVVSGLLGSWFRINEVESATEVGLCCPHIAPVRSLLGFLFHKVMLKH